MGNDNIYYGTKSNLKYKSYNNKFNLFENLKNKDDEENNKKYIKHFIWILILTFLLLNIIKYRNINIEKFLEKFLITECIFPLKSNEKIIRDLLFTNQFYLNYILLLFISLFNSLFFQNNYNLDQKGRRVFSWIVFAIIIVLIIISKIIEIYKPDHFIYALLVGIFVSIILLISSISTNIYFYNDKHTKLNNPLHQTYKYIILILIIIIILISILVHCYIYTNNKSYNSVFYLYSKFLCKNLNIFKNKLLIIILPLILFLITIFYIRFFQRKCFVELNNNNKCYSINEYKDMYKNNEDKFNNIKDEKFKTKIKECQYCPNNKGDSNGNFDCKEKKWCNDNANKIYKIYNDINTKPINITLIVIAVILGIALILAIGYMVLNPKNSISFIKNKILNVILNINYIKYIVKYQFYIIFTILIIIIMTYVTKNLNNFIDENKNA